MNDELLQPLSAFNSQHINECQSIKVKLKTIKGEYDICAKKEDKILNSTKGVNLSRMHSIQTKSASKLDELSQIRTDFLESVSQMDRSKIALLSSIRSYMA